jgi:MFS family permease
MHDASDAASSPSLFSPAWRNVSIGSIGLCSMLAFESMGVAAGMPAVAAALDGMAWYALAFASTLAGSVLAMVWSGRDCDRHGPFRSMAAGMTLFGAGLLLAGLASSMAVLVAGRIVQGLGVGSLGVALYVATARVLPATLHPRLFALFSSAWLLPALVGPAISGYVVERLGWRWLFLGILLLLLPAAALVLPALRRIDQAPTTAPAVRHALGWAWLAAAGSIALALGGQAGALAPVAVGAALGALALAALRLLPAGTLRLQPGLPTVVALRGLNAAAFFLCEAFVPLWLHHERGWSIGAAGLALTGGAVCWTFGSHLQSRVAHEARRPPLLGRGCLLLGAGIGVSGLTVLHVLPEGMLLVGWSIAGLGAGISLPMLGVLTLKLAPRAQQGRYSSALQLCAALATSAALSAGGVLFSLLRSAGPLPAYAGVFGLAFALALLGRLAAPRAFVVDAAASRSEPAAGPACAR